MIATERRYDARELGSNNHQEGIICKYETSIKCCKSLHMLTRKMRGERKKIGVCSSSASRQKLTSKGWSEIRYYNRKERENKEQKVLKKSGKHKQQIIEEAKRLLLAKHTA